MKTFKQFNESIRDLMTGKSKEEIENILKGLDSEERMKYYSDSRGNFKNMLIIYPPLKIGKVNGTDAFVNMCYHHLNEIHGENDFVLHVIYDEQPDNELVNGDTKFEFTYINTDNITENNFKGKFLHHRDQNLLLEIDEDYLERMDKIISSPENVKLNDEYYKMKHRQDELLRKRDDGEWTDKEHLEYDDLNFQSDTYSSGKECLWAKQRIARRKSLTSEERKAEDDRFNKMMSDAWDDIKKEEDNKD